MTISNSSEATTLSSAKPEGAGTISNKVKIVGIGGLSRSGKDSLAELFMTEGFYGVSFGDIIRDFARSRHVDKPDPISVANMTETANWLRASQGADAVLKEALRRFETEKAKGSRYKGLVLYSVRAPVEADFILAHKGEIVWVEADEEVRYHRMLENMREGEAKITKQEFIRQENLQAEPQPGVPVEAQMNAPYIKQKATVTFVNDGNDIDDFERRGKELVDQLATQEV